MAFLTRLSLANRALMMLVALAVTALGIYAVPSLKQQLLPSLSFPQVSVLAGYPGAAPQIVEDQVTIPLEEALRGVDGVTRVTSTSREANASVQVSFEYGTDIDEAQAKVQQAADRVRLPDGVEPRTVAGSFDDLPVLEIAVASTADQRRLADKLSAEVVPALTAIDGVKEASVTGVRDQVIEITPDDGELAERRLDASAISTAIRNAGIAQPAGTLTRSGTTLSVQVGSRFESVEDLRDLYLTPAAPPAGLTQAAPQGPVSGTAKPKPVRLGDVAEVRLVQSKATSLTRTNGTPSLGISVTMKPDGNAVSLSHEVRAALPDLTRRLGGDTRLTIVFDQAPGVEKSIESLLTEGLLGLAMAVLVILVFLVSIRSTVVTAVSIPLSVLIALIALWAWDYSLNMLTLGALTIAVGRVVDDSIVVLENIKRHLSYGEGKRRAVENGVREVAGAVTASTLTTVAVFLPIAFVGGLVGELFGAFSITVAVALLASLLVSLTVVPVLSYWFLKEPRQGDRRQAEEHERGTILQRAYIPVIRFATRRRLSTTAAALAVFIGTLALIPRLETSFIDNAGQNTVTINQTLPPGTSLAGTDAQAKRVEKILAEIDAIESYQVTVGGTDAAQAGYNLTLAEDSDTAAVEADLRKRIGALDGAGEVTVGVSGGFGGDNLEVALQSTDTDALRRAAGTVQQAMASIPGLTEVTSGIADTAPRIDVTVDREKAAESGLTEVGIGQAVAHAFSGTTLTQVVFDGTTADVVLFPEDAPASPAEMRDLKLAEGVRLKDVATVEQVQGPVSVTRVDGERNVSVTGKHTGSDLGAASAALKTKLDGLKLPAGVTYSIGGASAEQSEAFASLGVALVAAVALVFFVMVATFRSVIQPLILLVSIPFAATGAIGLLLITGTPLGLAAMIGLLMLIGIVVTNAIVLLDLINQYRRQGMPVQEAVIEGGRKRLRPILMTALATIFALLPMALGITGGGGFISKPLAVVVIGGLISSTLLTLVLVPALYAMVETRKEKRRNRRAGQDAPPAPPAGPVPATPVYSESGSTP
ncbi:HAE1 family hydrophobic/amphiphilic exporter-1 [Thermocatellispora tengchongensis]|uniref:HAE1 family hydrophobic/amphiphilic exporter-1 n=1 Tax=Thermocatellispora tengchongensis TaxID=1073253 RepID=A0A840P6Q2_9ACTN|nr:efflux RND transporter permease subunit [Thermocatellispora tengchongensis]MBB5133531.1 HAE1 family hydrophobic/amphiphilic exporter-1 [Thermocatellispora tengchongensis]